MLSVTQTETIHTLGRSIYSSEVKTALERLEGKIDTKKAQKIWKEALEHPYEGMPCWVHGDISAGNLLLQKEELVAVIDFGLLSVGDPSCDFGPLFTLFEGKARETFQETLQLSTGSISRAKGWVLWKALLIVSKLSISNVQETEASSGY